jgi:uncharacterized membrane protein YdjX (TVP38/TMEM64 family)
MGSTNQIVASDDESTPDARPRARRSIRLARLAAVVLVIGGIAAAYQAGAFDQVSDPKSLVQSVAALGAWGHVGFVVTYAILQPFGVPGTVFIVAAPLIWPWPTAFALSMIGTMIASVIGFSFARFIGRDWVAARIPARLRAYDESLERRGFQTTFLLRLIFWMPQWLHAFLGVSKVGFWTHFWASLLGYVPPLLLVSYMGSEIFDATGAMQPRAWLMLGALLAVSLSVAALIRRHERRRRRASSHAGS